ncbi:hypothetical protein CQW23_05284 [Capsicum baccatum]|uniref:Protein kinase domain-containing protein n=1 Tax=Capsicum baccatum TaxID=33114 RepID=A0A2G2XH30_CAPBA|nr:hypothetical protein CQW23_05284 [Capsicum baccatum]
MSNDFFTADIRNTDMNTCKDACLRNCSCRAASFCSILNSSTEDCNVSSEIFSLANNEKNRTRNKIILDVAKGLAYLHEERRQKILHLYTKPPNILDEKLNAKLSDFGFAKLIDRNQSQVMTIMKKAEEGQLVDLIDKHSEDMQFYKEKVINTMQIVVWCLQSDYTKRPSISMVIKAMEGVLDVEGDLDCSFKPQIIFAIPNINFVDSTPLVPSVLLDPR